MSLKLVHEVTRLVDGNVGAMTALTKLITLPNGDLHAGWSMTLELGNWPEEVRGPVIWLLYNDVCKQRPLLFGEVMREIMANGIARFFRERPEVCFIEEVFFPDQDGHTSLVHMLNWDEVSENTFLYLYREFDLVLQPVRVTFDEYDMGGDPEICCLLCSKFANLPPNSTPEELRNHLVKVHDPKYGMFSNKQLYKTEVE